MSFSHSSLSAQVKSYLTFLPEEIRQKILEHLHGVIHYEPVIGIMGKSGTGKSSLCNAIFQSHICATHPLNGCTRQAHRLTLQIGERRMTLVDLFLPGYVNTPRWLPVVAVRGSSATQTPEGSSRQVQQRRVPEMMKGTGLPNEHSSFYEVMLKNQIIKRIFFLLHFIPDYPDATHPFNIMMHNNIMK